LAYFGQRFGYDLAPEQGAGPGVIAKHQSVVSLVTGDPHAALQHDGRGVSFRRLRLPQDIFIGADFGGQSSIL